jgi:hypothetical protein
MQGERDGENNYGALQPWSMVLTSAGIVSVSFVVIGVIIAVFQAPSFADAPMILFIVGPIGGLFATWPIAPAQVLKASADVAECVVRAPQARR